MLYAGDYWTPARATGRVTVWSLTTHTEAYSLAEGGPVTAVGYASAGGHLGWATWELRLIPDEGLRVIGLVKVRGPQDKSPRLLGEHADDHFALVQAIAFSPDGTRVATAGRDGKVKVWSVSGDEAPLVISGNLGPVSGVALSPDGRRLAFCGEDKVVRVWDVQTGYEVLALQGPATR